MSQASFPPSHAGTVLPAILVLITADTAARVRQTRMKMIALSHTQKLELG